MPPAQAESAPSRETLQVTIEAASFRSDDGRFAVLRAVRRKGGAPVVLVGPLGAAQVGEELRVVGQFETHPVHGVRFQVQSYLPVLPTTEAGLVRFLGSGLVPGVGPSTAERIVNRFGARTLDVISNQRAKLLEVPGVGKKRAEQLSQTVRQRRLEAEQLTFLRSVGLGPAVSRRIIKRYGERATHRLKTDPYCIAEEIEGVGFTTADEVGRALGIGNEDPRRVAGAVLHLLNKAADEGNVFLPSDVLVTQATALHVEPELVHTTTRELVSRGQLACENGHIYALPLFRAETRLAQLLVQFDRASSLSGSEIQTGLSKASEVSSGQREAVKASLSHRLSLLTGGPGTGKTTAVRAIVAAHRAVGHKVVLCAPTGRAAKRMMEATAHEAKTIHRLLEWQPFRGAGKRGFLRGPDSPIEADLVLVDEASMLDLRLADQLIAAIPSDSSLVLVGDVAQLPPVSAGHVLSQVLKSNIGRRVHLTEVFRQAQASAIVRGAHAVLAATVPTPSSKAGPGNGDLFIIRAGQPDRMIERLLTTLDRLKATYGLNPERDVQVLTPMRKGQLGTERLNEVLQEHYRGATNKGRFLAGDRVMQLRNNYEKDVFNGDLGVVRRIDGDVVYVGMDSGEVSYRAQELDALTLAYASTVHKVQGSEFPAVVLLLHGSHYVMLARALLYTAVTRAQKVCVLIGEERALRRAAKNSVGHEGYCALAKRLIDAKKHAEPAHQRD